MIWVFSLFGLLFLAGLVYLFLQPKTYNVQRCIQISHPTDDTFNKLRDLTSWKDWSPWLLHEPNAQLTFSDTPTKEGGHYSWQGDMIGQGTLTHVRFTAPTKIEQTIEFVKPFKSKADIIWDFTDNEGQCEVCWTMLGRLPFFFRFLTGKIRAGVANDFELGLAMLKGVLEDNASYPNLTFQGRVTLEECRGLHRRFTGNIENMKAQLADLFADMHQEIEAEGYTPNGQPSTIYHQSKPKINPTWFEVDAFVPIQNEVPSQTAKRPGGHYFQVTLMGDYRFLKHAWNAAFANLQMKGHKFDWPRVPFEVYANNPCDVSHPNELKTTIYIPIK